MPLKTMVYVDAFNLYYGALKGTPYKWLDILTLVRNMLTANNDIVGIKYFTAKVNPRPNDPQQPFRQSLYLRALATINAQCVYGTRAMISGLNDGSSVENAKLRLPR